MRRGALVTIVGLLVTLVLVVSVHSFAAEKSSAKAAELRLAERDLWVGHIFWVRNVVLTTKLGDAAAAKAAEEQAVQNAKKIAEAVIPFYGKEAADKLFGLLAAHYGAIMEHMNAVFAGDKEAEGAADKKMTKNAEDIATFLSSANPKNWPKAMLASALIAHVGYHMAQINAINGKDFSSEAETWEAMKNQVYTIADTLAEGIVKQFPQKF